MTNPYRRSPPHFEIPDELTVAARRDDLILGFVMLVLGAPRVVMALAAHETFGAETTVAAITTFLGVILLVTRPRR